MRLDKQSAQSAVNNFLRYVSNGVAVEVVQSANQITLTLPQADEPIAPIERESDGTAEDEYDADGTAEDGELEGGDSLFLEDV